LSRLILGGNQLVHYTHCRDQLYVCQLIAHYHTPEKLLETFAAAEEHGVNAIVAHTPPWLIDLLTEHRRRGGKLRWITFPMVSIDDPELKEYADEVKWLVDAGCEASFLWGVQSDALIAAGKFDVIARCVEITKRCGIPSGVGAHDIRVIQACEENGLEADFYAKTLHHHDYPSAPRRPDELVESYAEHPGYWCRDPEGDIEYMKGVAKPWIAFKVLAAGTIPPQSGFEYAFRNGADFLFVGMFDYEIEEDANIVKSLLAQDLSRPRPWCG